MNRRQRRAKTAREKKGQKNKDGWVIVGQRDPPSRERVKELADWGERRLRYYVQFIRKGYLPPREHDAQEEIIKACDSLGEVIVRLRNLKVV